MVFAIAVSDWLSASRSAFSISWAYLYPAHGSTSVSETQEQQLQPQRHARLLDPAIPHAIDGLDAVELRLEHLELPPDALDVRGDGVVVEHDVRRVHELLAVLHVAGMLREGVHDPELRQRKQHHLAVPLHLHAFGIERERAATNDLIVLVRLAQGIDAAEQRVHARAQVRQAQVLRQEVVGAEAQARHRVELAVARGEENDGQLGGQRPQLPAQLEAAFRLLGERDVDDREIRQPRGEGRHGGRAIAVSANRIAFARERRSVVVADGRLVFNDGDELLHGARKATGLVDAALAVLRERGSRSGAALPLFVRIEWRVATLSSRWCRLPAACEIDPCPLAARRLRAS